MSGKKEKDTLEYMRSRQELRNCGNADHLTDAEGGFVSDYPYDDKGISIGYLEDLCQWVFYHNNMTDEEKLENIKNLEKAISDYLGNMGIRYIPTWSKKFMEGHHVENPQC